MVPDAFQTPPYLQQRLVSVACSVLLNPCLISGVGVSRHFDIYPTAGTGVLSCGGLEILAIPKMDDHVAEGIEMVITTWKRAIPSARSRKEVSPIFGNVPLKQNELQVLILPDLAATLIEPMLTLIITQSQDHRTYKQDAVCWPLVS